MEFRILGGLEAWSGPERLPLGGPRERRVLAILLLDADRAVPIARLVDAIWEDDPPATAPKQIRNAVSRLRATLAAAGWDGIAADGAGYRLSTAEAEIDALLFEADVARAASRAAAGDLNQASESLATALDRWHGPLLDGVGGRAVETAATIWHERRLSARETYFEYELALGRASRAVEGLSALVAEHPLREKPVGRLMLALARSGRPADALALFTATRERLADELGLDPSPALVDIERRIRANDPMLGTFPNTQHVAQYALLEDVRHFAGRHDQIKSLNQLLDADAGPCRTAGIATLDGPAGIGKTALALRWAQHVAHRFPDGLLYLDLRAGPMPSAEAARELLLALGVPPNRIPGGLEERAALYRSILSDRSVLVVLDDARDAEHVRPLLPGAASCFTLVTSRERLTGLMVAEGAQPVSLGPFTVAEAHELLERRLGPDRLAGEREAVAELVDLCAGLPLALDIVATHLVADPELRLTQLVAQLGTVRRRGVPSGETALAWAYERLEPGTARMFRLLALDPSPDISADAAATLAGVPGESARRQLSELVRRGLLTERTPGCFVLRNALRAYGADRTRRRETSAEPP